MQLRPDVDVHQVTAVLLELAQEVENVRGYGSGGSPQQFEIFANKYLSWVDIAESRQRNWWVDDRVPWSGVGSSRVASRSYCC